MTGMSFDGIKTASIDDTTLACCEQGSGEPVVFVHGSLGDLRIWQAQVPIVGRRYRAISHSRRYHRPNAELAPGAEDPWMAHVDDLEAFLRTLHASPAHLGGNSQCAFISLLVAIRYPDAVCSLVLAEPPVVPLFVERIPPRHRRSAATVADPSARRHRTAPLRRRPDRACPAGLSAWIG